MRAALVDWADITAFTTGLTAGDGARTTICRSGPVRRAVSYVGRPSKPATCSFSPLRVRAGLWRRDGDRRRSVDRAAHGALRVMGADGGPVDGAAVRLREVRGRLAPAVSGSSRHDSGPNSEVSDA